MRFHWNKTFLMLGLFFLVSTSVAKDKTMRLRRNSITSIIIKQNHNDDPGRPDGRPEPNNHEEVVEIISTESRRKLGSILNRLWYKRENGVITIPYYIRQSKYDQEYGFSQEAYETITAALVELEERSHVIRFRWWQSGDDDYIIFKRASNGCSSWIGRWGGYQDIWLSGWCETKGSTHHEVFHALGFDHEHCRPDRDEYITINWDKISKDWWGQYSINWGIDSLGTDYDYHSVMHYSSNGGKIDAGAYSSVIGQRSSASDGDIESLQLMYQCESGPRTLSEREANPCSKDCLCGITQTGCNNDESCQGDLVCKDQVCSAPGTSIATSKRYYDISEAVAVEFQNQQSKRIWIGVYAADADPRNIDITSAEDWSYPCGSKTCSQRTQESGQITLSVGEGAWKVYLINDVTWPYASVAFTDTFVVSKEHPPAIALSKRSYSEHEAIQVRFENPSGERVWIGVYQADVNPDYIDVKYSEDWILSCGTKSCHDPTVTSGFVSLGNVGVGSWRVFLIPYMSWPYKSLVYSETFDVHSAPSKNPTKRPTAPPTLEVTSAPTKDPTRTPTTRPSPTSKVVSIASSRNSYEIGEPVEVRFENPERERVWIAVYSADSDPNNLDYPRSEDWSWPCGSKTCTSQTLPAGTISLDNVGEGTWKVFLISDMTWPYHPLCGSEPFLVHETNS